MPRLEKYEVTHIVMRYEFHLSEHLELGAKGGSPHKLIVLIHIEHT